VTPAQAVAVAAVALAAGCASERASRPDLGPGGGPVSVDVSAEPAPGTSVRLDLAADARVVGSACATVDRWDGDGWRSAWWWERSSPSPQPIAGGDEVTCPALGVPLPTTMTLALPADLPAGRWRIAYAAGEDLGAYVFDVP
jgi:hypothetical protein